MMEDMRNQFLDLLSDIGFADKSRGVNVSYLLLLIYFSNIFILRIKSTSVNLMQHIFLCAMMILHIRSKV